MVGLIKKIKYNFDWVKVYNSPFKPPIPNFYIGKVAIGTPYFFPRKWVKSKYKKGHLTAITKKIGFNFVPLGWKTKWQHNDYRFEWAPIWSFVFFKWQIALTFDTPERNHYWECWLFYNRETDKKLSVKERLKIARKEFPCIWTTHTTGQEKEKICYWDKILKK